MNAAASSFLWSSNSTCSPPCCSSLSVLIISNTVTKMPGQGVDSGRLWPYLRDIGQEVEVCRRDLQEIEKEEDELAKAYIAEVLKTRDRQHEESWTRYMDLLEVLRKTDCKRIRLETLEAKHLDPVVRSRHATSRALSPNLRAIYGSDPITTERAEMCVSPPPKKHTTVLAPSASSRSCVPKQSGKGSSTSSATRRSAPPITTSTPLLVDHSDGHQRGVETACSEHQAADATPDSRYQEPPLVQRDPLYKDRTLGRQCRTQHLHSRDRAFVMSAVEELKEGVLEPIEHLFCVVILRAFVPSTMSLGTTMEEAYERIVAMPPCRARDVHMQQAHSAAKRYAAALHHEGFKVVKDLLPLSRREALFARANLPKELIATCKDVVRELEAHTSITLLTKPRTSSKYKNVRDIKVLLRQLAGTGWWTKCGKRGPQGEPARPRETDELENQSVAGVEPQEPIEPGVEHVEQLHADVEKVDGNVSPKCWPLSPDLPTAEALAALNRREEAWGTIDGALERFLVMADFYVVSHPPSSERGSKALEAFMAALQGVESAVSRRAMVLRRFQRCVVEVCPYAVKLAVQGVKTVRDLYGVDLVSWGLDPPLVTQVENMLAKMVAKHLYAEATGKGPEFEASYMAEPFDPRFQRSATDPYGRAPRLESVRVKLHRPKDDHVESEEADPDHVPLPGGLWSSLSQGPDLQSDTKLVEGVDRRPGPALPVKTVEDVDAEEAALRPLSEMTISSHNEHPHSQGRRRWRQPMKRDLCRYPGCGQRFSHLDSLRLHERTHVDFPEYHRRKLLPQLYRDSAFEACVPAYLPPYTIRTELETLRTVGHEWRRLDTTMKSKANHRG